MEQAVGCLENIIEDEGPFDGIFGFSQGAALTLSYFYQQQAAANPLPVKFACLFSTAMPLSPDAGMGNSIISRLRALEYDITDRARACGEILTAAEQEFVDVLQQTVVEAALDNPLFPWSDMDIYRHGEHDDIPRVMYSSLLSQKIQIPTIHVWGQNDWKYMIKMAETARSLCEESMARTVLHTGSHDIPKKPTEIKAVLRTIDWAMSRA